MADKSVTADRLRQLVHYDPETGKFTRRVSLSNAVKVGDEAGRHLKSGYYFFWVDGKRYAAHRLAWLYIHGQWPVEIDHRNGIRSDNRIDNLRDVDNSTNSENLRACRSDSKSGLLGVGWCKHHRKWKARIRVKGRLKHIKYCDTPEEAHAAYIAAKRELHAGCLI